MRLPLAVLLLSLLAGCSGGPGPKAPPVEDHVDPPPPLATLEDGPCQAYHADVDAPADAFQAAGPFQPAPGRKPDTIAALALGLACGEPGNRSLELWIGWRVEGGDGAVLDHAVLDNGTRAATLASWGAPAESAPMALFYSSQAGGFYSEGPGREDGSELVMVTAAMQQWTSPPEESVRFWLVDGEQATGSIDWTVTGASAWWSGLGEKGTPSHLDAAESWQGTGLRFGDAQRTLAWVPA